MTALGAVGSLRHIDFMSPPLVFDRALARRRLRRAHAIGFQPFLLARAADELGDRLAIVTRSFPVALDLGSPGPQVAASLHASGRIERLVRLSPLHDNPTPGVTLLVGDEEALPLDAASLDLVVSCLALQGVNDFPGTLLQVRRALKPDGLFLACLLGGATLTELRQAFAAAESEILGGLSPRVAPFADVRDLGGLLQRAGFALPVADSDTAIVRYGSVFGLLADLRATGMTNALAERSRRPLGRAVLARMAEIYAERFVDPDGRVRATFEFIWLSGWAPHESQPKPLRPGSAKARLADALGVPEQMLRGDR